MGNQGGVWGGGGEHPRVFARHHLPQMGNQLLTSQPPNQATKADDFVSNRNLDLKMVGASLLNHPKPRVRSKQASSPTAAGEMGQMWHMVMASKMDMSQAGTIQSTFIWLCHQNQHPTSPKIGNEA